MKIAPPALYKIYPPLFQQPFSKSGGPVKPPLFENLVGGSPPVESVGGGAHYDIRYNCAFHPPPPPSPPPSSREIAAKRVVAISFFSSISLETVLI